VLRYRWGSASHSGHPEPLGIARSTKYSLPPAQSDTGWASGEQTAPGPGICAWSSAPLASNRSRDYGRCHPAVMRPQDRNDPAPDRERSRLGAPPPIPSRSVVSDAKIAQLERQFAAYARSVAEVLALKQPLHIGSAKS
jgi:hypothetical protein